MTDRPIRLPNADHPISIAPASGRVAVRVGEVVIADSAAALTLCEARYPPVHYIPRGDVDMAQLEPSAHHTYCPYKGEASYFSVPLLGEKAANAVWSYEAPHDAMKAIEGYLAFYADRFSIEVV
ncbi:DUF427 domain-containing protein [Neoroseomonas lacus]|uniref:DUF427 domain-containing protein n=1 Tax=Neoroseomonas lacus TaxID=287609 RepID=A0A917K9P2_9PROT|nr:DUF427 domain-containing protein [Neoroseomonas lacus]GGJ02891.1 hypothetical protein GCM10011320_07210 [Neoroseomonas lacus]